MYKKFTFLKPGSTKYKSSIEKAITFINKEQLLKKDLWVKFVSMFKLKADTEDERWRCEYWGKMMRGACLCYHYENDPNLYNVLEETVLDLISTQDEEGSISTYSKEKEFNGWDVWGRKYVISGLLHFYSICPKEDIKNTVLDTVKKCVDYIISKIGKDEGKIAITDSSKWWDGINSASIIEPIMNLYLITKEQKYLDFANYIYSTGGIASGNLIDEVKNGKLPHQFPETKAYETMSFFEGVFELALVTNNDELKNLCIKFFNDINDTEISVTGNAGASGELFNNGKMMQVVKPEEFCQETCVTVTWMRIITKLLMVTGDVKYYDMFEKSVHNNFFGSINYDYQSAVDFPMNKKKIGPLPFDSYSPLKNDTRGKGTGGLLYFKDGTFYGCCACIGSAGIGLSALNAIMQNEKKELLINDYYSGKCSHDGIDLKIKNNFAKNGTIVFTASTKETKNIYVRIPSWANNPKVEINGNMQNIDTVGYLKIQLVKGINKIILTLHPKIEKEEINGNIAYTYGPYVLALGEENNKNIELETIRSSNIGSFEIIKSVFNKSILKFKTRYKDKNIIFVNYSSCGKKWDSPNSKFTVWLDK